MTKLTINSAAVIAFKALLEKRISKYWDEMKFTAPKPQVRLCGGSKFIRVETHREGSTMKANVKLCHAAESERGAQEGQSK